MAQTARRSSSQSTLNFALVSLCALVLAACGKQDAAPKEDIRPVRIMQLSAQPLVGASEFSGEVRARIESRVGFRVAGKISERKVDVGAQVKQGQVLARLDPSDLALGNAVAQAQVTSAKVNRDQLVADEKRFAELRDKGFISGTEFDRRKAQADAARAQLDQAQASARVQTNQSSYTALVAPFDGIVTGFEAETGQVVSAGQTVVRLSNPAQKEVLIAVPEQAVGAFRVGVPALVRLWAGGPEVAASVREISPAADALTRTFNIRVALEQVPPQVALGMTATVRFVSPGDKKIVRVPLSALLRESDKNYVWVFDRASSTVRKTAVVLGTVAQNDLVINSGLAAGQSIVTAGAHLLKDGQKVTVLQEASVASAAASAVSPSNIIQSQKTAPSVESQK